MTIHYYENDLPIDFDPGKILAIDTETMGLNPHRDRLCLIQMSTGDGDAHLVRIAIDQTEAPVLSDIIADPNVIKLFHFARFDVAALYNRFNVMTNPVYCTKIASKLVRTYTDRHGLSVLARELVGVDMSKQQQSSDWGASELSEAQMEYAASDVLYLHAMKEKLDMMLEREGRTEIAQACFDFLPTRAKLDLGGWPDMDVFSH